MYALTHLLTHSLTHLLTYSLTHLLTYSLTYLLTHSLTYSLTHLLTYSLKGEKFIDLMSMDKKVANGQLSLILLEGQLGSSIITNKFDAAALKEVVAAYCKH